MPGSDKLGDRMDKTQFLQKKNILMEKVADADMVLVGIGEEFNEDFKDIGKFPRLMAALEEVNFECQRLEIINSNLDFQLKEANRELNQNIAVLQALEEENEELKRKLK